MRSQDDKRFSPLSNEKSPLSFKERGSSSQSNREERPPTRDSRLLELVHIPKTGGSAIEYAGAKANITWGLCHWQERPLAGPGCMNPDWMEFNSRPILGDAQQVRWEPWHIPPALFPNESPYHNRTLFAVVRNPYERFLSEYYCPYNGLNPVDWTLPEQDRGFFDPMAKQLQHALKQRPANQSALPRMRQPETHDTLNRFLIKRLRKFAAWTAHYLPQSNYIFDKEMNQVVEHVLKYENLTVEFAALMQKYQLPVYLNNTVNQATSKEKRKMGVEDFYPETIKQINEVALIDFVVFGYQMFDPYNIGNKMATSQPATIQRIYYINLAKNVKRRAQMERWLGNQSIPYQRVDATVGTDVPEACVEFKQAATRCRGLSGLIMTELDIIRNYNTSGLTLVLEDDFIVKVPLDSLVRDTLAMVPDDWDIIRWDCWGKKIPSSYVFVIKETNRKVFRTSQQPPCNVTAKPGCRFCGGSHAMLWRDSSLGELESVWSEQPYDDLDCRLATDNLNSYCVNIGIGNYSHPEGESTDIPKIKI